MQSQLMHGPRLDLYIVIVQAFQDNVLDNVFFNGRQMIPRGIAAVWGAVPQEPFMDGGFHGRGNPCGGDEVYQRRMQRRRDGRKHLRRGIQPGECGDLPEILLLLGRDPSSASPQQSADEFGIASLTDHFKDFRMGIRLQQ